MCPTEGVWGLRVSARMPVERAVMRSTRFFGPNTYHNTLRRKTAILGHCRGCFGNSRFLVLAHLGCPQLAFWADCPKLRTVPSWRFGPTARSCGQSPVGRSCGQSRVADCPKRVLRAAKYQPLYLLDNPNRRWYNRAMKLLSVCDVAKATGLSERYIRAEAQRGNLKATRLANGWIITEPDFEAWLARHKPRGGRKRKVA